MADGMFRFKVFSGRGLELETTARVVNLPSVVGQLGFLPNHCDYVGLLATGVVEYTAADSDAVQGFVVSGGICTFERNTLTLLADSIDHVSTVDRAVCAKEKELLQTKQATLSTYDPEWELVVQRIARIEAIDSLLGSRS